MAECEYGIIYRYVLYLCENNRSKIILFFIPKKCPKSLNGCRPAFTILLPTRETSENCEKLGGMLMEENAHETESQYRILFESNPLPMWVVDLDTLAFLAVNEAAARYYGYSRDEFFAMSVRDIRPPEDIPALMESFATNTPGVTTAGLRRHRKKDGTVIYVESARRTLKFGNRLAALVVVNDLTEHQDLEEQLRQLQKLEAIGRLAGGIAHDFNNLLTVILGYSHLLLRQLGNDEPMRADVEEIKKAGERAESLTRQLLAFSRRQVLQPRVLDLNSVVGEISNMLRRLIRENIELETVLEPDLEPVKADRGQIEQVIMNLVVNAGDAMPEGGTLTLETKNVELDGEYVREHTSVIAGRYAMLAISDTGVGMDAKTKAHIFEPFFTTKEQGKGTGLGLSTVYGIVKQSGGNIWAYSEPGRGTTFKVYLPSIEEAGIASKPVTPPTRSVVGSETILLLEDEASVRSLARSVLEENGYTVLETRDGEEALRMGEEHEGPISLMLTDIGLRGMDGKQVAKRVRSIRPEMKILFMSGYTDLAALRRGFLDPDTPYLAKPFTPSTLVRKVREVLDLPSATNLPSG